jgi:N-acetylglutamate synthase-like GNAT family acetyltransferase
MKIHRVQKKDASKVLRFIKSITDREFGPSEHKAFPLDDIQSLPKSYGGKREAFFIALDASNHIIATCGVKEEGDGVGILRRVFVHPGKRRQGVGKKIVTHAIDFCHQHQFRLVQACTTGKMQSAIMLLYELGFQERARLKFESDQIVRLTYDCGPHRKKEETPDANRSS